MRTWGTPSPFSCKQRSALRNLLRSTERARYIIYNNNLRKRQVFVSRAIHVGRALILQLDDVTPSITPGMGGMVLWSGLLTTWTLICLGGRYYC